MNIKYIGKHGTWREIADSARTTVNMESGNKEPTSKWKKSMLLAEHSPIRKLHIQAKWYNLPYWVSVHITRHAIGILHFCRTQRTDRTEIPRDELPQGALIEHEIDANAQACINISRKRLCYQASSETREAWTEFIEEAVRPNEPELASVCVKECVYRNGFCPEYKSCGYVHTEAFKKELDEYLKGFENNSRFS